MAQNQSSRNDRFEDYIPVAERIEKFYERYPEGRINTTIVTHEPESGFILMRAEVYRSADDVQPAATGHAYEVKSDGYVQRTSYIEVCETSSVGRALALLGFEVKRGIASREEMEKASRGGHDERPQRPQTQPDRAATPPDRAMPAERAAPQAERAAPPPERPATATTTRPPAAPVAEDDSALDADILSSANELGYDAAKVRKWVNQKYEVTGGLDSLTGQDKREVLKIFRERVQASASKAARK